MRIKYLFPILFIVFIVGVFCITANEHNYVTYNDISTTQSHVAPRENTSEERRMVDMIADDSYLIEKGDSTIFILVGNFAAHHNGAVILADSAVRYSNQSFECFGNVLINQNSTYAYGDRASYNRMNSTATLYSDLIKVVDGEAVMYTYNCSFDTANEVGRFSGGCYVDKGESHMESDRGYYYTESHELIAVDNVEMRDETYLMNSDSVIFNTQTEDAKYFTNTNIWNDKEEYLFANEGSYTKSRDLHHLTRDAYILSPEREIWSDSIEYYRTDGHIIGRNNIQVDDTTKKIMGFADYGEWWDEPGNALFTRRPSMINYDTSQTDSVFLAADTLWLYTIAVLPPVVESDSTSVGDEQRDPERSGKEHSREAEVDAKSKSSDTMQMEDKALNTPDEALAEAPLEKPSEEREAKGEGGRGERADASRQRGDAQGMEQPANRDGGKRLDPTTQPNERPNERPNAGDAKSPEEARAPKNEEARAPKEEASNIADSTLFEPVTDSLAADTTQLADTLQPLTVKQLRAQAKAEKRRMRDSIRAIERGIRDSIDSIKNRERDSIQTIRDSLLKIKVDSIIAKRIAESSRRADEEKARIERIKQRSIEREHRKIDRAKARAARRGKEYTGPDYTRDTLADSTAMAPSRDSLNAGTTEGSARDTMAVDTMARDSMRIDTTALEKPFPADSSYKMIKAYRNVRMYRSDTQLVCDSLVTLNTDSIIRLYRDPILWSENNQITSDSMAIHTMNQNIRKAHFMGDPIMGVEIDTMYYNQVKGKEMIALFADGKVYRNDVNGNAQTIYYLQDDEESTEVTGLMYIESAGISFYFDDGDIDKIAYKQNPEYVIYPMSMIPETQARILDKFEWHDDKRPTRMNIIFRHVRPTRREEILNKQRPRFRITERIDYDRRRLTENRMWEDRVDELTPDIVEWRDSRTSNKK